MKIKVISIAGLMAVIVYSIMSCDMTPQGPVKNAIVQFDSTEMVKRGAYLVKIAGCGDCHSPKSFGPQGPIENPDLLLSGHPSADTIVKPVKEALQSWVLFSQQGTSAVGPWGQSFAANLTSDDTGIGTWSYEQFSKALREGKWKGLDGSRPLLPPMPWPNYVNMKDEDMRAIFAYLKSTKPVHNIVPAPRPPVGM